MTLKSNENWDDYSHYLSKSRLSTFSFCPLQFKKMYIDQETKLAPNYAMSTGTRFHNFAETFFDVAPNYPVDTWEDFIHPDFSPQEQSMIQYFIDQERERLSIFGGDIDKWMPIGCEMKFLDHKNQLRGIIDRIDQINDLIVIVEYKTGKSIYKPSLQREFGFYKILLQTDDRFKGKDITCCVINPRIGQIEFMSPSRESTIFKAIENLRNAITNDAFPPNCTPAKLAMCGLCNSCEEANLYQDYKKIST